MPAVANGTQAVAANAVSATVTGTFVLPYVVTASASWNTTITPSAQTLSQFTVTFSTPAPPGGGTLG